MKKIFFISIIGLSTLLFSQEFWLQKPSPTTRWLTRICFTDTLNGWVSGDSGTIIHTSNGGQNWITQNSGQNSHFINDLFFLNASQGWAVWNDYLFTGTKILTTTNGGTNWLESTFPDSSVTINTVYFRNPLTGFAGSSFPGKIFKTTNGGNSWIECRIDTNYCPYFYLLPKNNIHFLNSQTGFACGGQFDLQGMVWKTTDSGLNWFSYCIAPEPLFRIKAITPTKIIAVGGDLEYGASSVNSFDTGDTWKYDLIGPHDDTSFSGIGLALAFRTASELWVPLGFGEAWGVNLDTGSITSPWIRVYTSNNNSVYDAVFVTPTFGWACGYGGILLKYNPALIGIAGKGNVTALNSVLFQNYPNPFNPSTTISYYLGKRSFVRITVYDVLGRVVYASLEGVRGAGLHKLNFSSEKAASGIYFYTIQAGDWTETKKMVLVR